MTSSLPHLFCLLVLPSRLLLFFFFNDTATTETYTLSLHDALPISLVRSGFRMILENRSDIEVVGEAQNGVEAIDLARERTPDVRSEEHTSELQSRVDLVCRLLLEKKKKNKQTETPTTTTSSIRTTP